MLKCDWSSDVWFFSRRRRHTRFKCDWSSDVCSSDLARNCLQVWPPLLFTGSDGPTSSTSLTGNLSVQTDRNGNQVEYNGHPLYTFSGDSAPGQTNGDGLYGVWFVATSNLAVQGGGSEGGGYGRESCFSRGDFFSAMSVQYESNRN